MTAPPATSAGGSYEGAGRQVAVTLRGYSSVLVISDDVTLAAHAAVGIALAESANRLVMIADLGGDTAPIQALVRDDDPHGIYDSFEFGTSFVRIAREVEGAKNVYVMPSGTESPAVGRIIGSPRWSRFASEFAGADELLLIVVAADAPELDKLAAQVDGMVLVGLSRLESVTAPNILAKIPHPAVIAPSKRDIAPAARPAFPFARLAIGGLGVLVLGIAAGALLGRRPAKVKEAPPVPIDSVAVDSARPARPTIVAANAADSALATPFSVEISFFNTLEGANFEIQRHGSVMPAATISLVPIGDTEAIWYKVHAGAYVDSAEAERLLATLRRRRVVPDSGGSVVRVPLAMLVDSIPAQAGMGSRIREKIQTLAAKDVKAYALMQPDGSARVYAGAFERPDQSSLAATALRVAGLNPVLSYRTGRLR